MIFVDGANPLSGDGSPGNPYKLIQAGVNAATTGTTVSVAPGVYSELVTIATPGITLLGGGVYNPESFPTSITGGQTRANGILVTANNTIVDGFKLTLTTNIGLYIRGPSVNTVEIRNCWFFEVGGSGIGAWGVPFGTDPVPSNWRGIQNLSIHHNIFERCCNALIGTGGNEHCTLANGIYNVDVHHNTFRIVSTVGYSATNGGEGLDAKEGVELGTFHENTFFGLLKNPIYLDAGRSNTATGGYTRPGFVKNIHVYNNVVYSNTGHGITATSEADFATSATGVNGRKGGQINDIYIDYNTIYGNSAAGVLLYDRALLESATGFTASTVPLCDNVQIVNNICHGNDTVANPAYAGINHDHRWATNSLIKKNISTGNFNGIHVTRGAPTLTGNINTDPLFVSPGTGNFALQVTSPAINAGGDAFTNPATDFLGVTRSQADIGAYEKVTSRIFDTLVFDPNIFNNNLTGLGLVDPVYRIKPSPLDFIRRSDDPQGLRGSLLPLRGHLVATGKTAALRRVLLSTQGHLVTAGKVSLIRRAMFTQLGHLQARGKQISFAAVHWLALPNFSVNRAGPFPQYIPNIRNGYLIDPQATVTSVTMENVDLGVYTYDAANDRIVVASDPGTVTDTVLMRAHIAVVVIAAPTGLTVTGATSALISLDWADNPVIANLGYRVYRSTDGGATYSVLSLIAAAVSSYTDNAVVSGNTYFYKVTACTVVGGVVTAESAQSSTVSATATTVAIPTPIGFSVQPTPSSIILDWADNPVIANLGYRVYRSTNGGASYVVYALIASATSTYTDSVVTTGNTYFYKVTACTVVGGVVTAESAQTAGISATVPAASPSDLADWITRSTGAGVVWAHNFDSPNEVAAFDVNSATPSLTTLSWSADGFAGGGSVNIDVPTGGLGKSGWWRPLSAVTGATNGKGVDDRAAIGMPGALGAPNGPTRLRTWNKAANFRHGYYGHSSYWTQYPTWQGDPTPWDGDESTGYYFQFRVKIPASRWAAANVNTPNGPVDGKLVFFDNTGSGSLGELIIQSTTVHSWDVAGLPTGFFQMYTARGGQYTGGGQAALTEPQGANYGAGFEPGYNAANCHVGFIDGSNQPQYTNGCWRWPADEWVTVLLHFIPGQQMSDLVTFNLNSLPANTGIEVWVARATDTAYTKIWSKFDYRWVWGGGADGATPGDYSFHPPANNSICFSGYMNGVPAGLGFYHRFTQAILSKQFIPCPQPSNTYTTVFPLTENPINEGGKWVTGGAVGLDWTNPLTTGGHCVASVVPAPSRYSDDIAHLSTAFKTFTPDQYAEATVYRAPGYNGNGGSHEIELHLRQQITAHNARGYEIGFGLSPPSGVPYMFVVKWNGAVGSYMDIPITGSPVPAGINDGDLFRVELRGTTLKIFRKPLGGVLGQIGPDVNVTSFGIAGNDSNPWTSGQPGMGFWPVDGAIPGNFGWKSFTAGNLP